MDFVADNLFDGRKLRMLTVVDLYIRECLAIDVGQSLKGEDVARVLTDIASHRGLPQTIKTDNGSEFISKAMDKWAYEHGVELNFSRPASPPTTPPSRASTGDCAKSASTGIGSCHWTTPGPKSKRGDGTSMRPDLTQHRGS